MLNSLACDGAASTCPDSVRPLIDIGSLDVVSFMLMFVMSGVRDGTTRGKLKNPKTSRYSSSFGAGSLGGIAVAIEGVWWPFPIAVIPIVEERGWFDMRKSRSNAQRRISARILTVDGVARSPSVAEDC